MKGFLKKLGIDIEKKHKCVKCKKEIPVDAKICPYCDAWNDCCSPDPRIYEKHMKKPKKKSRKK
jgi:hypothetical protein